MNSPSSQLSDDDADAASDHSGPYIQRYDIDTNDEITSESDSDPVDGHSEGNLVPNSDNTTTDYYSSSSPYASPVRNKPSQASSRLAAGYRLPRIFNQSMHSYVLYSDMASVSSSHQQKVTANPCKLAGSTICDDQTDPSGWTSCTSGCFRRRGAQAERRLAPFLHYTLVNRERSVR